MTAQRNVSPSRNLSTAARPPRIRSTGAEPATPRPRRRTAARLTAAALAGLMALTALAASAAEPKKMTRRQINRAAKQAEKALAAGQSDEAAGLYEQVLGATAGKEERRGEALYALAMLSLSPEPEQRDLDRARELLTELETTFPNHPRELEIRAADAWLDELAATQATTQEAVVELTEESSAAEEAAEQADDRVATLEEELRRARAELAATRADLRKKEEALQQLKDAMVRGKG